MLDLKGAIYSQKAKEAPPSEGRFFICIFLVAVVKSLAIIVLVKSEDLIRIEII